MNLNIYLPQGYSKNNKYPVLYILHGYGGSEEDWMPSLQLHKKADELIKLNKIKPLIIVSPHIENSFGLNTAQEPRERQYDPSTKINEGMYEDYLIKEVIPYIDANYSTAAAKETRYIGGLSMGGYVALNLGFSYPELFSKVGGHSPALFTKSDNLIFKWLYPNNELRKKRDPILKAQEQTSKLRDLSIYLDCGAQDSFRFYEGIEKLYKVLQANSLKAEYHLNPGGHVEAYWWENREKYLLFYASL